MNITKGKFKKLLKAGNKKQTNKIKKKVHFRRKKSNNRSLKKGGKRVNLRVKTLKYGGTPRKRERKEREEKKRKRERKEREEREEKKRERKEREEREEKKRKGQISEVKKPLQKQASINFAKREEAKPQAKLTATSTATKPVASTTKPVTSTTKPITSTTKPVASTTKPITSATKPVTSTTKPVTSTTKPVTSTTKPVTSTTKPVASTTKPVASTTKPVASTTKPVASATKPVASATKPVTSTTKQVTSTKTQLDKLINDNIVDLDLNTEQPKITKFNNTTSTTQAKQVITPANSTTISPPAPANTQGSLLIKPSTVEPQLQPPPKSSTEKETKPFLNINSNSSGINLPPPAKQVTPENPTTISPTNVKSTSSGPKTEAYKNRKKRRDLKPIDRPANTQGSLLRKPSRVEPQPQPQPPPKSSTEQETNPFLNINSNSSGTNSPPPPPSPQQNRETIKKQQRNGIDTRADEKARLLKTNSNSSGKKPPPPPLPTSPVSTGPPRPVTQGPVARAIANPPPAGPPVSFSTDRDRKKPQSTGKMEYNVKISIAENGAVTTSVNGPTGGEFDANLQKFVGEQFSGDVPVGGGKKNKKTKKNKKNKKTKKTKKQKNRKNKLKNN